MGRAQGEEFVPRAVGSCEVLGGGQMGLVMVFDYVRFSCCLVEEEEGA